MPSPCLHLCRLDAARKACRDCGRTLDEIARWTSMSDEERRTIMAGLAKRLRRIDIEEHAFRSET